MHLSFRVYRYTIRNYCYIVNKVRLWFHGVTYVSAKIDGKLYILNLGQIILGKNIYINSSIYSNLLGGSSFSSLVTGKDGVLEIGNNVGISNSSISAYKRIKISDNVIIGNACKIFDTDFHPIGAKGRLDNKAEEVLCAEIIIYKNVFIGTGTTILKGVTIGENSVIGAHSVVTKSIPANEIWAGNPARKIRHLNEKELT